MSNLPILPIHQILSFLPPRSQSITDANPPLYHILFGLAYTAAVGFLVDLVETGRRVISRTLAITQLGRQAA